ncbi:MAG: type I DNA topoisomerase [Holosporales bacterium]|jgi:DNA topoisomerase-1|nr:type I DNA topoisomerase [Holosporales bacterium]
MKRSEESVVIVESPAKASTIGRFLGHGFKVLASYGHVRDLLSKNGSVDTDHDFNMTWAEIEKSRKHVNEIIKAVNGAGNVFLATDPDREGEAIAWHISELITQKYGDKAPNMQRVIFHEIVKKAVLSAMQSPRSINDLLVNAYLARRALDYLVGYSISPILWKKLPGSRSAGRVQSVALRLIVEREQEIEKFDSQEYWTIGGIFSTAADKEVTAKLHILDGKKLGKLDIGSAEQAQQICSALMPLSYAVTSVEKKQVQRFPAPPFTTSTLQQEASRKLGFGASRTMRTAQTLYEGIRINGELVGLITYMRTDSVTLSMEALHDFRDFIQKNYGKEYLPNDIRVYKTKAKNAQEAHEAIRPTQITRRPADISSFLNKDQLALYELIWKRAIASQMENALFDQVTVDISDSSEKHIFRAVGTTQKFDGFLKVYQEGLDEADEAAPGEEKLPPISLAEKLALEHLVDTQHFTQPPPRFTEASLVKKLEELGIGRPSTYAPLMQVLQDRGYATIEKRQFVPSDRGRIVTAFLTNFCKKYLEYDFTANMEEELDDIANGVLEWKSVMRTFWTDFSDTIAKMSEISITDVIEKLENDLSAYIFKNIENRRCDKCNDGMMGLKLSKFGAFLGCNNYPACPNRKQIDVPPEEQAAVLEPVELGVDPTDNTRITVRKGPYGFYLQFDPLSAPPVEPTDKKKKKASSVKRVGIPPSIVPSNITLQEALVLKSFPLTIGQYEGHDMQVSTGRFGPYVKCGDTIASIPKAIDFMQINLEEACSLIEAKKARNAKKVVSVGQAGGTSGTKLAGRKRSPRSTKS